ncbi:MAG: 3-phosphoshikimate 1-carboxyvinyltransferase [Candidatus Fischerbacteria bacterium RBG_13_37_8]|uniref:3-phosphoshikimate 1-carboxyvinyltransferase n=1 Tax=Candidatus Fischerbacteria bacterium RBG_13_37_8 TaxID=1817863 RepID=A0A1F5VG32_9BACT|nr:MAG: 3-phosphoshikimate 1-carboxyvinyltransferase [Candidatus Fischerbacteria bacterium RBG_13_37_8]
MNYFVKPGKKIYGEIECAGDKSISHRLALLGALASGDTIIRNYCTGQDFQSTLHCLAQLGVQHESSNNSIIVHGVGLHGLSATNSVLDAGNSGTTIRLLTGILAAQKFASTITGDDSLIQRPMKRIIEPLSLMGAQIEARKNNFPPLSIRGTELKPVSYILPVGSAQVKSAILLAALYAKGVTKIYDPFNSRNHTENLLPLFNAELHTENGWISLQNPATMKGINYMVPGDFSSAAFFISAALLLNNSSLLIRNVGLNPTRTGLLKVLHSMGAVIPLIKEYDIGNEMTGDFSVSSSELASITVDNTIVPSIIDELPLLAVLATKAHGLTIVKDAKELRYKETDRIKTITDNLTAIGIQINELKDGFTLKGPQTIIGGTVDSYGDHRIAMAMAIAGIASQEGIMIKNTECINISNPQFFTILNDILQ